MLADLIIKIAGMEAKKEAEYRPRPSSAGPERCLRQLVYRAQGITGKPIGNRFIMVLDDSSWHEELTADWIRKSAFQLLDQQKRVICGTTTHRGKTYEVVGHIDGLIRDMAGVDRLWEHKAVNHFSFERMLRGEYPLDYLTQCVLYLTGLNIKEGVLLVKNKNTSAYLEYLLSYCRGGDVLTILHVMGSDGTYLSGPVEIPGLYQNAFKRFELVEAYRAAGKLPPRQYDRTSDWQCSYCQYYEVCYEGYEQEFSPDTVPLDDAALAAAEEYKEVTASLNSLEKRKESLRKSLKDFLISKSAAKARGNGTLVSLSFQKRRATDTKLIPPDILASAQTDKTVEVLKVAAAAKTEH